MHRLRVAVAVGVFVAGLVVDLARPTIVGAAPGDLDLTFGTAGRVTTDIAGRNDGAETLMVQSDGRIVAAGGTDGGPSRDDFALARYLPDGSLDPAFGNGGRVTTDFAGSVDNGFAMVQQPDGKLVVAGSAFSQSGTADDFALARYLPDGSLDPAFGNGGRVTTDFGGFSDQAWGLVLQSDGKLVAAGSAITVSGINTMDFALARYLPDGNLDPSFGNGGRVTTDFANDIDESRGLVLQSDGKLVAAGYASTRSAWVFGLARYQTDGSLDPGFGTGGLVTTEMSGPAIAYAMALGPDDKVVVAGSVGDLETADNHIALARYRTDGSLDPAFGAGGLVVGDIIGGSDGARDVTVQPGGKTVVAASSSSEIGFVIARFRKNGRLDRRFGSAGVAVTDFGTPAVPLAVALQPDSRIVAAGTAGSVTGDFALARYLNSRSDG
jgi:uncharacterized delta-60 repeat protein